jgi:hypothetical protein
MSEIEAVGDVLAGGVLSRTVEPSGGGSPIDENGDAGNCLNCGNAVSGNFCDVCGQKRNVHRTIGAIGHELVHAILHLDGKLWRTLPLLAWRPGELTRRYVHGERVGFVSPLAMFLFSVFLMFAALQVQGQSLQLIEMASPAQVRDGMDQLRGNLARQLGELREVRSDVASENGKAASMDARIAQKQKEIAELDELRAHAARLQLGQGEPVMQIGLGRLGGGNYVLAEFDRNPRLAIYRLQSNSYKFSWLLIPLSVPFMWLLFVRSPSFRSYDHTVFVTYSMAFMSLLATLLTVMGIAGVHVAIIGVAGTFIPPIHIYRQLKHAYGLGWPGALARTFALTGFCFVIAGLYLLLLLAMGG